MRPLEGVRVVEVATWAFLPSAANILADWGADVIKIEHPERADPVRGLRVGGGGAEAVGLSFMWELQNRGKRDLALDLGTPGGREILEALLRRADVFMTNLLPRARRQLGLEPADVHGVNADIVYGVGSGMGPTGPEADRGGFDLATFWARSGLAYKLTDEAAAHPPTLPSAGFGDILAGSMLAGGIVAALAGRRPGQGVVVETSLLAAGMWSMRSEITACDLLGVDRHFGPNRGELPNPIVASYRTQDGRSLQLVMLDADRHWPDLCQRLGRRDLIDHPRFADMQLRAEHSDECVAVLEEIFASQPLAFWQVALAEATGVWAVVQTPREAADDPQAQANGYVRQAADAAGMEFLMVPNPVRFDGESGDGGPAPTFGEHTDEVLAELGYDEDAVMDLRIAGAVH